MIYLDNSATTRQKPLSVVEAVTKGLTTFSANPGRSGHIASLNSAIEISKVREQIASYFNCSVPENVIFTQNCTDALNLALLGTAKKGGHVVTTAFEHNSTLRPLHYLKSKGIIDLSIVEPKDPTRITADDIKPYIRENTYLVSCVHISNVDGAESDIKGIGELCKNNNLLFVVDGAQSAGHKEIDMIKDNISLLALAGHKALLGPQGIGVLLIGENVDLRPIRFGGTGTQSIELEQPSERPECFESGTIALPNILGLGAGIEFVKNNKEKIDKKIAYLTNLALSELSQIKAVKIYTDNKNLNGVIGFNISNIDSGIVCEFLNEKYEICVRGGLHCAPLKHKFLGTVEQGIVRVSLSYFSTEEEIKALVKAIKDFIKTYEI